MKLLNTADRYTIAKRMLFLAALLMALCPGAVGAGEAHLPASAASAVRVEAAAGESGKKDISSAKAWGIFITAFAACFALGAALGSRFSPNFEDSRVLADYVSKNAKVAYSGNYQKLGPFLGMLTIVPSRVYYFPVGATTWVYDAQSKTPQEVSYDQAKHGDQPEVKARAGKVPEAFGALTMLPLGAQVYSSGVDMKDVVGSLSNGQKMGMWLLAVAAVFSGAVLGFLLAYRTTPERQSKEFRDQLGKQAFWEKVAEMTRQSWIFSEVAGRVLVKAVPSNVYLNLEAIASFTPTPFMLGVNPNAIAGASVVMPVPFKQRFKLPPPEVLEALKAVNEANMATRLQAQAGAVYLELGISSLLPHNPLG